MSNHFSASRLVAVACLSIGLAAPAVAQDARTIKVGYRDLNLASSQGVAALKRRTNQAIANVCGDEGTRDLARKMMAQRCRRDIESNVAQQVAAVTDRTQQVALNVGGFKTAAR